MAQFKPYKVQTEEHLNALPIKEGQFIVVEATQKIYLDKDNSHRILLGKANSYGTSLAFKDNDLSIDLKNEENGVLSNIKIPITVWNDGL